MCDVIWETLSVYRSIHMFIHTFTMPIRTEWYVCYEPIVHIFIVDTDVCIAVSSFSLSLSLSLALSLLVCVLVYANVNKTFLPDWNSLTIDRKAIEYRTAHTKSISSLNHSHIHMCIRWLSFICMHAYCIYTCVAVLSVLAISNTPHCFYYLEMCIRVWLSNEDTEHLNVAWMRMCEYEWMSLVYVCAFARAHSKMI